MPRTRRQTFTNRVWITRLAVCLLAFGISASQRVSAISIAYEVEDLADTVPGQDLRRYTYQVSDHEFQRNQGFTIYFDADDFSDLEAAPASPNGDWDVITGEPVPLIGQEGIYDALSIVNAGDLASLADPFTLSFVWNGAGDPGSQRFEINEFDEDLNFVGLLASGFTVPAGPVTTVPEGGSALALLALGLCGITGLRRVLRN